MKNLLSVLILVTMPSILVIGQSYDNSGVGMVSYERVLNYDGTPSSKEFTLVFTPEFSLFFENEPSHESGPTIKPSSEDEFDLDFSMTLGGARYIVKTDFARDTIESQVTALHGGKQQTFIVQEKIMKIKWTIENDFKMIDKLKAQKATGQFRGRKYVAWFSNEIPVRYGPWKLNGLAGLILSVADEKNEVLFHATSIKVPYVTDASFKSEFNFSRDAEKVSLARFRQIEAEQGAELTRLIASKLPRGAKVELKNPTVRTIELEYEE